MQGSQMVYFHTKNPILDIVWMGCGMENVGIFYDHLEYLTVTWCIFGRLVQFVVILYIFPVFGMFERRKSCNPSSYSLHINPLMFCQFVLKQVH
jgi:hypothetical protein